MASAGQLLPNDHVWTQGMTSWRQARDFYGQWEVLPPVTAVAPMSAAAGVPPHLVTARTSMILGIIGLLLFGVVLGPLAIIFASMAMSSMNRTVDTQGKGMATTGLVLGIVDTIFGILFMVAFMSE